MPVAASHEARVDGAKQRCAIVLILGIVKTDADSARTPTHKMIFSLHVVGLIVVVQMNQR